MSVKIVKRGSISITLFKDVKFICTIPYLNKKNLNCFYTCALFYNLPIFLKKKIKDQHNDSNTQKMFILEGIVLS